ncbi:hypothetical protein ANCCAN_09372 [Ancylostoma caninum]|uniref:Uncharacterized protein n=1 Tax=Ancylostoma caninum TaxID=29170 RepID=A0A368GJS1_ANCCA|nr:hypothetical protein ANCCAN_09372 [Ancylostoma caninum]
MLCCNYRLAIAEAKPTVVSIGTATEAIERVEAAVGETTQCYSIATETQRYETVDCGADALQMEVASVCQTSPTTMAEVGVAVEPSVVDADLQTDEQAKAHFGVNTDEVEKVPNVEKADQSTATEFLEKAASVDQETMTTRTYYRNIPSQTDSPEVEEAREVVVPDSFATAASSDVECQTETGAFPVNQSIRRKYIDRFEVITADSNVESIASDDVIGDTPVPECARCRQREETFTRNVGVGACAISDKVCIECDKATPDEVDENDAPGFKPEKDELRSKEFDLARAAAVKKLLTSEQKQPFVRGTAVSRSARLERNKGDDLEYIAEKNKSVSTSPSAPATTPSGETADALKNKVVLKKEVPPPPSNLPDPIPARIPRPKISKYALPAESAETPDEEEEAVDRLTPLRSELRSLGRYHMLE